MLLASQFSGDRLAERYQTVVADPSAQAKDYLAAILGDSAGNFFASGGEGSRPSMVESHFLME
jgi:hypothetical protein